MGPQFLSEKRGERPMGVYLCESKRFHVVYDFFDVCLCFQGFKQLHENVSDLLSESNTAPSYVLRFAYAAISISADDLLHLLGILDEAMDRVALLDLEKELTSSEHQTFDQYQVSPN